MQQPADAPRRLEFIPTEHEDVIFVVVAEPKVVVVLIATLFVAGVMLWRRRRRGPGQPCSSAPPNAIREFERKRVGESQR